MIVPILLPKDFPRHLKHILRVTEIDQQQFFNYFIIFYCLICGFGIYGIDSLRAKYYEKDNLKHK